MIFVAPRTESARRAAATVLLTFGLATCAVCRCFISQALVRSSEHSLAPAGPWRVRQTVCGNRTTRRHTAFGRRRATQSARAAALASFGDGWLALMRADERLFVTDASGITQSAVALPRRQRRGVPTDLVQQTAALTAESKTFLASLALGVTRLSDGNYLVVHADSDFEQVGNQVEYTNTTYWASVVSPDLQRGCVDEPITFPSVDLSRAVFHGDTLLLPGRTAEAHGNVRTTQRRYAVSPQGCQWIPLPAISYAR